MQIKVSESYPGELEALGADDARAKAREGLNKALGELVGVAPRGGELDIVEHLTELMASAYEAQAQRLADAIQEVAQGGE